MSSPLFSPIFNPDSNSISKQDEDVHSPLFDSLSEPASYVRLEWITPDCQHMIAKCARVSNPTNQENRQTEERLLKYLVKHKHWSPFEMAHMCLEIKTTRGIAAQILRHRSFSFQEFSQRYAESTSYILPSFRLQDSKNRQNSLDVLSQSQQKLYQDGVKAHIDQSFALYENLLANGIAKECARFVLPLCTETTMYMCGSIRSWIHYIQVRSGEDTQLEHRKIALEAKSILLQNLPALAAVFAESTVGDLQN